MKTISIGAVEDISFIDYPNKLSTVIFTLGCNFNCPYCHNKHLINKNAHGKHIKKNITSLLSNEYIEGLVITGGEPTLQKNLIDFIKNIKQEYNNISIKLDTNGTSPNILEKLIKDNLIQYIAMDIKNTLDVLSYSKSVGKLIDEKTIYKIKKSIDIIEKSDIDYEFRTTVVKTITPIDKIKKIAENLQDKSRYYLQQYIQRKNLNISTTNKEYMLKAYNETKKIHQHTFLRLYE
jgi:pyruvate formate lyase activating enzyme